MTATQASRHFSELLSRVSAGEEVELTRAGAPVAVIAPPRARALSAARFRELMAAAPSVDEAFLGEVRAARRELGAPEGVWPS